MNKNNELSHNPPAYPTFDWKNERVNDQIVHFTDNPGMTLLDYFAAKAMAVQINAAHIDRRWDSSYDEISKNAYDMAEAMLAERQRRIK